MDLYVYFQQLYSLGARKVIVTSVGPIGCIPYQLARFSGNKTTRCNENINKAILLFNSGLRKLVHRFNGGQLPGSKFVLIDSYQSSNDLYMNATNYGNLRTKLHHGTSSPFMDFTKFISYIGFEVIDKGCCGVGRNNGQITCLPLQQPCDDRGKYLFWDAFHPTEFANIALAKATYTSQSYTYPINIQQLANL